MIARRRVLWYDQRYLLLKPLQLESFPMQRMILIASLLLVLLAGACNPATPESEQPISTPLQNATEAPSGYPYPPVQAAAPYNPYPDGAESAAGSHPATTTPVSPPTQDAALGSIRVRVLENGQPITYASLYLAEIIIDENGKERAASYSRETSPRAFQLEDGAFLFVNIRPGRYALIMDTVLSAYLLHNPDNDKEVIFDVPAGQETALPDLNYDDLPIPKQE